MAGLGFINKKAKKFGNGSMTGPKKSGAFDQTTKKSAWQRGRDDAVKRGQDWEKRMKRRTIA